MIPASAIVQVNPNVIGSGGNPLSFNGVILTANTAIPVGSVQSFSSAAAVSAFFGPAAIETLMANVYFQGRDNATVLPGKLLFSQYNAAPVSAYLRGGVVSGLTLAQLQALSGVLTVTIDGATKTSTTINLAAATSFSNAATLIAAQFTALGGTVTYDSQRGAFVITSSTTGATSTISVGSGTIAAGLMLTTATGAILSQGAALVTPGVAMDNVVKITTNWAAFGTAFEPVTADKMAFSAWTNNQNRRYAYIGYDSDVTATQNGNTSSWGAQIQTLNYDGSFPIFGDYTHAAFALGCTASLDFTRTEGRITYAFKSLAGLAATVTDQTIAANLAANGYNFYGQYATAAQNQSFMYPGLVSGKYKFFDEYINEIWLNNQLQLAVMTLLTAINSIPYNQQGYSLIEAACLDPINGAVLFGAIRAGVPLSAQQSAQVNAAAGVPIAAVLGTRGWYLQILPATAQVRGLRGSPPITLWYCDGGSVQQVTLASIVIQ
jgi:hypothetical protein